jgi:antitoxin component YwqK of YwqJK toxin-antitoxin module
MTQDNSINNDGDEIRRGYYKSGALWWETSYVNGKRHGIDKWYRKSGALSWEIPYVNGEVHGIEKYYDEDGANIEYLVLYKEDQEVASIKSNIYGDQS